MDAYTFGTFPSNKCRKNTLNITHTLDQVQEKKLCLNFTLMCHFFNGQIQHNHKNLPLTSLESKNLHEEGPPHMENKFVDIVTYYAHFTIFTKMATNVQRYINRKTFIQRTNIEFIFVKTKL